MLAASLTSRPLRGLLSMADIETCAPAVRLAFSLVTTMARAAESLLRRVVMWRSLDHLDAQRTV